MRQSLEDSVGELTRKTMLEAEGNGTDESGSTVYVHQMLPMFRGPNVVPWVAISLPLIHLGQRMLGWRVSSRSIGPLSHRDPSRRAVRRGRL